MQDWQHDRIPTITSGKSFGLVDSEGNAYLDGVANMWCNVWGHGSNPVVKAIIKQFERMPHSTLFGLASETASRVSYKLTALAKGMDKVFFTDNGSCAIEAAMKMALQYWYNKGATNKTRFVSLEHGYHGDTSGAMSVGFIDQFFKAYKPMLRGRLKVPSPVKIGVSKYNGNMNFADESLRFIEHLLSTKGSQCAAFIVIIATQGK